MKDLKGTGPMCETSECIRSLCLLTVAIASRESHCHDHDSKAEISTINLTKMGYETVRHVLIKRRAKL